MSLSQNAFIPGRSISDSVVLAQELFCSYLYDGGEECVTTATFSVCLSDSIHRFFLGDRGLRYGDLMSPYLFVLVMEVLQTLLSQANPAKSQLILSKSAHGNREAILQLLDFQEGLLPVQYLRLSIISSQLKIFDCQPVLCKIDKRLKGWEGVGLSFVGRLQLIKSIIIAFHVYWGMAFILPKGIIREVEKRMRTFL
ncbi:UNVERIFIED_CONTAM: hypothetical protein Slati_3396300 [Sesamum latifolium]|uniref:Reverse transcriptase domain-containing protein n=1 Tax=Sesamum latifolium TaxID=2727402 RepID=A0AAW2UEE0_9LAMI